MLDEPKKKKTRGKKKKEEPKLPVESAAVQARAQWLEDRTRMSLALHPQFRIGALSIFGWAKRPRGCHVGFHTPGQNLPVELPGV